MYISNWMFIGCVLAIAALVFYQIFTGYTAAHLNYDGTKIELREQKVLYITYAGIAAIIFLVIEVGTVGIWGNGVIDYFNLSDGEQDQLRWVVIGGLASIATVIVFVAMLGIAKLAEICGRRRIILRPNYTIIKK